MLSFLFQDCAKNGSSIHLIFLLHFQKIDQIIINYVKDSV